MFFLLSFEVVVWSYTEQEAYDVREIMNTPEFIVDVNGVLQTLLDERNPELVLYSVSQSVDAPVGKISIF